MRYLPALCLALFFLPGSARAQYFSRGYVWNTEYEGTTYQKTLIRAFDDVLVFIVEGESKLRKGDFPEVEIKCVGEGKSACDTTEPIRLLVDEGPVWVRAWWIDCGGILAGVTSTPYFLGEAWVAHGPGGGSIGDPNDGASKFLEGYMGHVDPKNCKGKSLYFTLRAEEEYLPYLDPLKRYNSIEITMYPWQPFRVSVPGENGGRMFHIVTALIIGNPSQ